MRHADALVAAVESLKVAPPTRLTNLVRAYEVITTSVQITDPAAAIVDAAVAGELTTAKLDKMCASAVAYKAAVEYRSTLAQRADRPCTKRFAALLAEGDADAILDGLRPAFDDAATRLAAVREMVDPSSSAEALATTATPEQLQAWRTLPDILTLLERISRVATTFGVLGRFPLVDDPRREIGSIRSHGYGLRDEAILCVEGDLDQVSQVFAQPHPVGDVRTSPWLRLRPKLFTIGEAGERLRAWSESVFDAEQDARGKRYSTVNGELVEDPRDPNPFRLEDEMV
jgi:hypothetical protein